MALLPAVLSVVLMVPTHRLRWEALGVDWPIGLLFGAAFQVVCCLFLYGATGSRLPLVVLGSLWGILAMPFLGRSLGGGVMLPAVIGDQVQFSGWILQGLGIGIPFLVAGVITVRRVREASRPAPRTPGDATAS
ncbi:MAG TPA: hypothetical protein H9837_00130 [Candidatus Brachybacterium merdigallinarum]|nr:hypothetical protein [Candidatus Brachybacterium merdigallinarum]